MTDGERPATTNEEIERTGRSGAVAGSDEVETFGAAGTPAQQAGQDRADDAAGEAEAHPS